MATATEAQPATTPSTSKDDAPFDLTVDLFSRMIEAGMIPEDRRVYLDDGRLYEKMAKSKPHGFVGAAINMAVATRLPPGWSLWPECTVVLDDLNAPLPDFSVIRGANPLDFAELNRYPDTRDIGLLVEIGVTSVRQDLTTRMEKYARALIPVYWVIDVPARRIVAHSEPRVVDGRGVYARVETYASGQSMPLVLDGREVAHIPFDDLLR